MKKQKVKNGRKLLYIIMVLLGLVAGCAAAPELTSEEVTQINVMCKDDATCIIEQTDDAMRRMFERLAYEREDRLIKRRDDLIIFLNACHASDTLVLVEIRQGFSVLPTNREKFKAVKEYGYPYTHDNVNKRARIHDMKCMNPRDIFQNRY